MLEKVTKFKTKLKKKIKKITFLIFKLLAIKLKKIKFCKTINNTKFFLNNLLKQNYF